MTNILVVTSDISFGELIRQNLEELGRFHVCVAGDKETSVSFIKEEPCPLTFLDTCLPVRNLLEIGFRIRQANPRMRFIVIARPGRHVVLDGLSPEGYLSTPLSLPDFMTMMENLFPSPQSANVVRAVAGSDDDPAWLSDFTRAAQHLTRLTLESSAQAALITREDVLWAYAGQLPQSAAHELTEIVSRYWDRQKENDLVRFVHLASTRAEHMLYATRLTRNMVLALIFDAETPFGTIHTQANQLVHSLSTSPSERQDNGVRAGNETPSARTPTILSGIPSPNPKLDARTIGLDYVRESNPLKSIAQMASSVETEPSIEVEKTVEAPSVTGKYKIARNAAAQDDPDEASSDPMGEAARKIVLESTSPSVYNLDYACLLVPRFPHHHLTGDLSDRLPDWVQETCIAFGWRLDYISVQPEYLLWIANVPPATPPAYLMRIMRQRISGKIFEDFPRFNKENPSGDFWAPSYLMMGGSQPPPVEMIKDFITQTRQRQGIPPQLR